jgi:ATP-dependent DNA helicase RecQ
MGGEVERAAREYLKAALGDAAEFRDGQLEAILALADRGERVVVVERTGWGKSVVYFLATRLLRDRGAGPTILISPLLALMRDQLQMAERLGVRAASINSTNSSDWREIESSLADDTIDLLLVSPERLANERFRQQTLPAIQRGIGLFVVDEAHCISDWGHDFRPDYRRIERIVAALPGGVPLLATTATANDRVIADVVEQLGADVSVIRGQLGRESLRLQVITLHDQAERLAWLADKLPLLPGSGIVYTLTVADALRVSDWLRANDIDAPAYYGGLETSTREALEDRLRRNEVKALVATVALGLGFDKPDLSFVIHFQRPGSAVAYYQQIGRAGRAVESADVVLLAGAEDDEIADYFIHAAFPPAETLADVLRLIEESDAGLTVAEIEAATNASRSKITQTLKILEVDEAIFRQGQRYVRSANAWMPDTERIERVTAARRAELARMRDFVASDQCLMEFLARELDDPAPAACGRCANCREPFIGAEVNADLQQRAIVFLKRAYRPIEPRKRWPGKASRKGSIPGDRQLRAGYALSLYGVAGWGQLVREAKYSGGAFPDELVDAVAEMVERDWQPDPRPGWLTAVPSLRHPMLVPGFAERLASRLALPYREALVKLRETPPQKTMQNSAQQLENIIDAFGVVPDAVSPDPVLLVDDIVDSRWSLTVCGVILVEAGSGPVHPVVLADAGYGNG